MMWIFFFSLFVVAILIMCLGNLVYHPGNPLPPYVFIAVIGLIAAIYIGTVVKLIFR
jgi:hypothetical protein